ncbi:TOG array regulator of axonemal microtubules protein 2 [Gracilinanus agilis]|uniref:TOG array regulator of axonemal microtubules protein 2 n=1 Tax=Gracilinanus agilis TaxID=191870 RepID=UPI001CFEA75D|nr:TOG array regulator of axonemal microtubules protein 2 [Gracilinanus agilis]
MPSPGSRLLRLASAVDRQRVPSRILLIAARELGLAFGVEPEPRPPKFRAPVAIYCGSVPRTSASSGFRTFHGSTRNISSSLQDYGSRWTGEASPKPMLKVQKEKQSQLWVRNGDLTSLKTSLASKGWPSRNGHARNVEDVSPRPHPLLPATIREMEANSAALETTQIKDKLKKRRLSEGLPASPRAFLDPGGGSKGPSLKSAIPRSSSQRPPMASRPMPPIQSIPTTPETKGSLENGSGPLESSKGQPEATPAAQEVQISLQYLHCKDEKMRRSLGGSLIPPILKAGQPTETKSVTLPALTSNPTPLPSGQDVFTVQEVPGKRLAKENSPQEKPPKSTANSLPAVFTGSTPEWEEEEKVESSAKDLRPLSNPEVVLINALQWIESNDWQMKEKGLVTIRRLATCHSDVLAERLHDVCLAVMREVVNLRSKVSRLAISTLGHLFRTMKKNMDPEAEEAARCLLQKMGDTSEFIQKAADYSLGAMVENVTLSRSLAALTTGGVHHRNPVVRKCTAEHLWKVLEQIGAEKLLSGTRESTERLIRTLVKLAQDSNKETRLYGRKMINILMSNSRFDTFLKHSLPSHDLQDVMMTIKQRGVEENIEPTPIKGRKLFKNVITSEEFLNEQGCSSDSEPTVIPRALALTRNAEMVEQLKELNTLLTSKEYQSRMEGITLLLDHCKNNVDLVTTHLTLIFDAFIPKLQDANKKVNQCALESFAEMVPYLKDNLRPVLIPLVTAISDNLNSKNPSISGAAEMALDAMIMNMDNVSLLQAFSGRLCFMTGRATCELTQRLAGIVTSIYSQKPQAVERYILPVLWYFLNNMIGNGVLPGHSGNVRPVVCQLIKSLYEQMGSRLQGCAAGQPKQVRKMLQEFIDSKFQ